jgi:hypothetical protein
MIMTMRIFMKRDTTSPAPSHLDQQIKQAISDSDYPLFDWLEKNGRNVAIGAFVLLALLFIGYRMSVKNTAQLEKNYFSASQDFAVFQKEATELSLTKEQQDAFAHLQQLMQQHPDLQAKYEGALVQTLLNRNQTAIALPIATQTLKRVKNENIPFYEDYARTSLLISQQSYAEALKQAVALKDQMLAEATNDSRSFGDLLFAFNMLRIPLLLQKTGTPAQELAAWAEWKAYASGGHVENGMDAKAFATVGHLFDEGQFTLANYIAAREKALN